MFSFDGVFSTFHSMDELTKRTRHDKSYSAWSKLSKLCQVKENCMASLPNYPRNVIHLHFRNWMQLYIYYLINPKMMSEAKAKPWPCWAFWEHNIFIFLSYDVYFCVWTVASENTITCGQSVPVATQPMAALIMYTREHFQVICSLYNGSPKIQGIKKTDITEGRNEMCCCKFPLTFTALGKTLTLRLLSA